MNKALMVMVVFLVVVGWCMGCGGGGSSSPEGNFNEPAPNNELPPYSPNSSPFKSNFFRNGNNIEEALLVLNEGSAVNIREVYPDYGASRPVSRQTLGYKIVSALRMLGYTQGYWTSSGEYPAEKLLNKFQRLNNFPISSEVRSETLQKIDEMLAEREKSDESWAYLFPILIYHFVEPPINEPSKEHSAMLYSLALGSLPPEIVNLTEKNIKTFFSCQLSSAIKFNEAWMGSDYQILNPWLYNETVEIFGTLPMDDYDIVDLVIHEYGHFIDKNIYWPENGTSKGIIDTTEFYAISYDISQPFDDGWIFYPLRRPGNEKEEFVGNYAVGWESDKRPGMRTAYEDFAESFTMYVIQGKTFRELAKTKPILKKKYEWLRDNIFWRARRIEYDTGDPISLKFVQEMPNSFPFNSRDYAQLLADFVFDYQFPKAY